MIRAQDETYRLIELVIYEADKLPDFRKILSCIITNTVYLLFFVIFRDAKTITSKFMRHQAFQSELQSNRERLVQLRHAAVRLAEEKPEFLGTIDPQIVDLSIQWEQLEKTTEEKGQKLFDANRQQLYVQSISDMKVTFLFLFFLHECRKLIIITLLVGGILPRIIMPVVGSFPLFRIGLNNFNNK